VKVHINSLLFVTLALWVKGRRIAKYLSKFIVDIAATEYKYASIPNFFAVINITQLGYPPISLARTVMNKGINRIPIARSMSDLTMRVKFVTFSFSNRDLQIAVKVTAFRNTVGR
jgi:hypothetical protein